MNQGTLAMPPGNNTSPRGTDADQVPRTGKPDLQEIAATAGWGSPENITRHFPVARFEKKDLANDAAKALQERVAELARSADDKRHWEDGDVLLATANPHFFVVAEKTLSRSERALTVDQMKRARGPKTESMTREEALVRAYLPKIRGVLESFEAMEKPPTKTAADLGLTDNDERVLLYLNELHPRLCTQADIEAGAGIARKTVSESLTRLLAADLVRRPQGERKGNGLTEKGKRLADRLAPPPP